MEFPGADGCGGPLYVGSGCFHRRESLCGLKFSDQYRNNWNVNEDYQFKETSLEELKEESKALASCTYEENTLWGKEVSLPLSHSLTQTYTHLL